MRRNINMNNSKNEKQDNYISVLNMINKEYELQKIELFKMQIREIDESIKLSFKNIERLQNLKSDLIEFYKQGYRVLDYFFDQIDS